jgi:hypothetical protein
MKNRAPSKRLSTGILALALALDLALTPFAGSASAQATGDRTAADAGTTTRTNVGTTDPQDRGFTMGWLGLLGLAGLAGLLPKKVVHHRTGATSGRPIS